MIDTIEKKMETVLDDLSKTSIWVFSSLVIIVITVVSNESTTDISNLSLGEVFKIFGFEVKKKYSGIIMFSILLGLNFYMLKLFVHLHSIYKREYANPQMKQDMMDVLKTHSWVFNPFAQTSNSFWAKALDISGYPLLNLMWWLGFSLAFKLTFESGGFYVGICIALAIAYSILGIISGFVINEIVVNVAPNTTRLILANAAILLGIALFCLLNRSFFQKNMWLLIFVLIFIVCLLWFTIHQYKVVKK